MSTPSSSSNAVRGGTRSKPARALRLLTCAPALALAFAAPAGAQQTMTPETGGVTATLEQCVTSTEQAERSATFTGEMSSIAGATKMSMRIDIEERLPDESEFHMVSAPGLGVWRAADPKVKVYKYLKQVSNLSSPASYRGLVRFRWINAQKHVIKRAERLTTRCLQPTLSAQPVTPPAEATAPPAATAGS
ncbi:MAG TPA: hypothetical protein VHT25_08670 [Solirubrobacteraceae bacterium]|jgi:hypothetical protein|nr:hypothetical protein [Solirubrobacteraceae bacterium]